MSVLILLTLTSFPSLYSSIALCKFSIIFLHPDISKIFFVSGDKLSYIDSASQSLNPFSTSFMGRIYPGDTSDLIPKTPTINTMITIAIASKFLEVLFLCTFTGACGFICICWFSDLETFAPHAGQNAACSPNCFPHFAQNLAILSSSIM